MQKQIILRRRYKVLLVVSLLVAFLMAIFFLMPKNATAMPDHLTLTWVADPQTTQTITWRTEVSTVGGQVEYAEMTKGQFFTDGITAIDAEVNDLTTNWGNMSIHSATIRGLKPGTRYIYRVGNGMIWSEINSFITTPVDNSNFKFLIFGDSQGYRYNVWRKTLHQAYKANPDAVFMTNVGDLVDIGLHYEQWNGWFEASQGVIDTIPIMPVAGNHETYTPEQGFSMPILFTGQFKLPGNGPEGLKGQVYSFNYGNVHFTILDSQEGEEEGFLPDMLERQKHWLAKDLKDTDKQWKIVLIHRPPYHNRSDEGDENLRRDLVPIFDQYHVDVVFSGHDHNYARSYPLRGGNVVESTVMGTIYVTTGRSGDRTYSKTFAKSWDAFFYNPEDAPNYLTAEVAGGSLLVKTFKQNGTLIDTWSINKDN